MSLTSGYARKITKKSWKLKRGGTYSCSRSKALADLTTPHQAARQDRERLSETIPRRTLFTRLTKVVESPLGVPNPVADRPIDNPSSINIREPSNRIEETDHSNTTMLGNNIQMNEEDNPSQNHPPHDAHGPPYPTDIEAEVQRRVNEVLERKREDNTVFSLYPSFNW
ncbi:hypothetical protein LIER_24447 [Lithospermum erythrorhizon]|uniref:Uncharacterized protein n=1 Tax=Lithospermum erythrorhizon TaxID=34254 RepID=A0AAV3R2M0_LITER